MRWTIPVAVLALAMSGCNQDNVTPLEPEPDSGQMQTNPTADTGVVEAPDSGAADQPNADAAVGTDAIEQPADTGIVADQDAGVEPDAAESPADATTDPDATTAPDATTPPPPTDAGTAQHIGTVFLILLENHNWDDIEASTDAPYINNTLLPMASYALNYVGNAHPSEPNYIWLEAGDTLGIRTETFPLVAAVRKGLQPIGQRLFQIDLHRAMAGFVGSSIEIEAEHREGLRLDFHESIEAFGKHRHSSRPGCKGSALGEERFRLSSA